MASNIDRVGRPLARFGIVALTLLAACAPAPPFEEVSDPFAPLPQAAPVTTQPLVAPGAISDEVITTVEPVTPGPITTEIDPSATPPAEISDGATDSLDTVTEVNDGGLVERLPNTCMLENYQQYQGSDGLIAVGLVTDRPARLVAPGDIVDQRYNPQRVNFFTNGEGQVVRISCG
ncbi:MAG: I78 family peptidase inhibitor [Pseudomonadota bacterium]